jgi:hypothetical protein
MRIDLPGLMPGLGIVGIGRARRVRAHLRLVLSVGLLVNLIVLGSPGPTWAADCATSGPAGGSYSVTVCLSDPVTGAAVSGPVPVTATATVNGSGPGVQRMVFYLDGQYLLTDFQSPYTFALPSDRFLDATRALEVEARMRDGFVSGRSSISLVFSNGVTSPPPPASGFAPTSGTAPAPGQPLVVAATGDGAGGEQRSGDVTNLIASWDPNVFLYLGDVYEKGTETEFANWYGQNSYFGRFGAITDPTIGNHEYENGQAPGYFNYWRSPPHYYSFDAGGWHFISLDSTSQFNQTAPGSAQYQWLKRDLAASTAACTLAYFHHPVYNVGPEGSTPRMAAIWSLLDANGVDVVLSGHDHDYQRWVPLDGSGSPSAGGITQFVAGGGGHGIQQFVTTDSRLAKGFDTVPEAFGALRLELNARGAAYQYVNSAATTLDSGSVACDGAADTTAPSVPTGVTATAAGSGEVDLSWSASTDNVGVTGYDIFRNDSLLASAGPTTAYTDLTVDPELTYRYQVRARDAAGNVSALSDVATATTPARGALFSDDFESGSLSKWTSVSGLVVQQEQVFSGAWAARGTSTGAATWAYERLDASQVSLYYRIRFNLVSQAASNVNLLKFRTGSGASLLGVYVSSSGRLAYRNDVIGQSLTSLTNVSLGTWHTLQVHVVVNGAASQTETWLDNVSISQLSRTESLGTDPVGRIQLGENSTGRIYDVAFDDVVADTAPIAQ